MRKLRKESRQCNNYQNRKRLTVAVLRRKRWDKIQELVKKTESIWNLRSSELLPQPNKATADGEVDLNAFQHYNFLNNWNKENGKDLVAIADTFISQSVFTQVRNGEDNKYTKVEEIPENGEIAVPNDATNESRALYASISWLD